MMSDSLRVLATLLDPQEWSFFCRGLFLSIYAQAYK
jgi:hypothetical protein